MNMEMEWSYVGAVVISGLVIVFVALILLIISVWIMGKIFDAIKASKNKKKAPAAEKAAPAPAPAAKPAAVDNDDESEIIAVISAAVAMMSEQSGVPLRIRSIKRSSGGRNAWAAAAANENTKIF